MAVLEVILAGLALPAVPMSQVVESYTYDLLPDGRWVNKSDNAIARVETVQEKVTIAALVPGLFVGGRQVADRREPTMARRSTPAGPIQYRGSRRRATWACSSDTPRARDRAGPAGGIGASRTEGWHSRSARRTTSAGAGPRAARAKEKRLHARPRARGRRQAALVMGPGGATVIGLHERCPTFVINGQGMERVQSPRMVSPGDFIVTGTSVVAVREPAS
jgi:hypothetical protein